MKVKLIVEVDLNGHNLIGNKPSDRLVTEQDRIEDLKDYLRVSNGNILGRTMVDFNLETLIIRKV